MKELLTSTDFKRYRKKQLEEIVKLVKGEIWCSNPDYAYIKGAIEMGRKMIRLPEELITDNAYKARLSQQVQEDLNRLVVEMTRGDIDA